jgi:hypothetical protein
LLGDGSAVLETSASSPLPDLVERHRPPVLQPLAKLRLRSDFAGRMETRPDTDSQLVFILAHGFRSAVCVIAGVPPVPKPAVLGKLLAPIFFVGRIFPRAHLRVCRALVTRLDGAGPNRRNSRIAIGRDSWLSSGIERRGYKLGIVGHRRGSSGGGGRGRGTGMNTRLDAEEMGRKLSVGRCVELLSIYFEVRANRLDEVQRTNSTIVDQKTLRRSEGIEGVEAALQFVESANRSFVFPRKFRSEVRG